MGLLDRLPGGADHMGQEYLINQGYDSERKVKADFYDYTDDGKFVTFWVDTPSKRIAALTLRADNVYIVEWNKS